MIAYDFEYYRPDTLKQATDLFIKLNNESKSPIYYSGGTEFISMARMNNIFTKAVIDIKTIPECNILTKENRKVFIGSAVTLTQINESNIFPLLAKTASRIADHTIQDKVTLGGNICGTIIYRSAVLPLLLTDCTIMTYGPDGAKTHDIHNIFNERMLLGNGEFVVQAVINEDYVTMPYSHAKITKQEKIDYPLIESAAIRKNNEIRIAFSALCGFPFRSVKVEQVLNNKSFSPEDRLSKILCSLPGDILSDISGSAEYRRFVLGNVIQDTLERLGL